MIVVFRQQSDRLVTEGAFWAELEGPWQARVTCPIDVDPLPAAPTGPAKLVFSVGGKERVLSGTVRRGAVDKQGAKLTAHIVGGAGRLLDPLDPKGLDFSSATTPVGAGLVLAQIATRCGEVLAAGVKVALDKIKLPRWHVAGGMPAAESLGALAAELGRLTGKAYHWRILPAGTLWLGEETWPTSKEVGLLVDRDTDDGSESLAKEGLPFDVGYTIDGRRVGTVETTIGSGRIDLRVSVPGDPEHRPRLDLYARHWTARVVKAHDDGRLDVRCDDARMGELLAVELRVGLPGCRVEVPEGARLEVGFEGASPAGAFVHGLGQVPATEEAYALALVGDQVQIGTLSGIAPPGGGAVVFTFVPAGGGAPVVGPTVEIAGVVSGPGHKYAKGVRG